MNEPLTEVIVILYCLQISFHSKKNAIYLCAKNAIYLCTKKATKKMNCGHVMLLRLTLNSDSLDFKDLLDSSNEITVYFSSEKEKIAEIH